MTEGTTLTEVMLADEWPRFQEAGDLQKTPQNPLIRGFAQTVGDCILARCRPREQAHEREKGVAPSQDHALQCVSQLVCKRHIVRALAQNDSRCTPHPSLGFMALTAPLNAHLTASSPL